MITAHDAFVSASKYAVCEIAMFCYDYGDNFVFFEKEEEDRDWPIFVSKSSGIAKTASPDESLEFWDRCDSLPTVEVSL